MTGVGPSQPIRKHDTQPFDQDKVLMHPWNKLSYKPSDWFIFAFCMLVKEQAIGLCMPCTAFEGALQFLRSMHTGLLCFISFPAPLVYEQWVFAKTLPVPKPELPNGILLAPNIFTVHWWPREERWPQADWWSREERWPWAVMERISMICSVRQTEGKNTGIIEHVFNQYSREYSVNKTATLYYLRSLDRHGLTEPVQLLRAPYSPEPFLQMQYMYRENDGC